ncbi:CoA binding domain protein [Variibacter gotjawalensis]|uniref:CoA binding domain protein n=1 Tax=Variibacter gotjawalensis TaxID=1333996 RepID=A0A0S3PZH8_9BRAD|nr:acetate--CoA ligase family protein [Variibacter gotjawalensis]NIK47188.1 acyl-CoA synthetase (NDP forming) [Variibacter gotjawalensis]RZS49088.1 acyl-CoA synthetase (NDP forming) [Variibacter gotjawalensis]BAT61350.1 CoA binding domain protein [Variibacter gotjawalensis]
MSNLKYALNPRSIAIVGASDQINKIGGRPLHYLAKFGFQGKVYPINPARPEVQGVKSFAGLDALPEVPDMVCVAVAGDNAERTVIQCAEMGVKVALVMASGFSESDPVNGAAAEQRMIAAGRKTGMRIFGPNMQGLANFGSGAIASFSTMFLEMPPEDGPVAILSQSGAMSVVPYGLLRQRGIGVRHTHATGNDADVSVAELSTEVAKDPNVKLLLLYLEGMPDPHFLAETAAIARERNLPVLALKSGRTAAGAIAAASHTGALATEDRVVDAFFEHHGIYRVKDVEGLVESAELFLKGWKPKGRNLVAISNSGAVCVLSADAASNAGMPMAKLALATREGLGKILPSFATTTNPIDITAALLSNSGLFSDILPVIAKDAAADAFLIGVPVAGQGYDVPRFARDSAAFAAETGKPLVVAAPQPSVAQAFAEQGLATFATESAAIRALDGYLGQNELAARLAASGARSTYRAAESAAQEGVTLNEAESLAIAEKAGIPVAKYRLCQSAAECVEAWRAIGGPVAVKACSRDIPHKSEYGLVKLGVNSEAEISALFETMTTTVAEKKASFDGVIVAAMAKGQREFMIGAHRDPVFGPVVAVGDGGKYIEALGDVRLLIPPFSASDVERALRSLRIAPLLDGVRGDPPLDIAAFGDLAAKVGALMLDAKLKIASIDLNPVMVFARGEGCVIADALVVQQA